MIGAWVGYGTTRPHSRKHRRKRPRPQPKPRSRLVRHGPMEGRRRAYRFLMVFAPVVLVLFILTITHPSPVSFGAAPLRALHVLPMLGFLVVLVAALLAALVVRLLGQRALALTVLAAGLLATVSLALAVSNVFRAPILSRMGARMGAVLADRMAAERETYERVAFSTEMLGSLSGFLLPEDVPRLRGAFYRAYLQAFGGRYYLLVDRDGQREAGYDLGYDSGQLAGGKAARLREKMEEDPSDYTLLTSLRETELPDFIEGFEKGYEDGWRAGFIAQRE